MRRGRTRILIAGLTLALLTGTAHADNSRNGDLIVAHGSGLICSSIKPVDGRASCDTLCADKGAACVSVEIADGTAQIEKRTCADPAYPKFFECRCCAIAH